jgi:hypothetical protein
MGYSDQLPKIRRAAKQAKREALGADNPLADEFVTAMQARRAVKQAKPTNSLSPVSHKFTADFQTRYANKLAKRSAIEPRTSEAPPSSSVPVDDPENPRIYIYSYEPEGLQINELKLLDSKVTVNLQGAIKVVTVDG